MKNILFAILFSLLSLGAVAQENTLGLGVILGNPTGLSGNYRFTPNRSLDAAVGWDAGDDENFYLHSTYLFRTPKEKDLMDAWLGWYAGVGGRFIWEEDDDEEVRLGVRGSLGLSFEFKRVPVEFFGEIAPVLDLVESTDFDLDAAIGARYYF